MLNSHIQQYKFLFDVETSGLPIRNKNNSSPYTNLYLYKDARLLSISFIILNSSNRIVYDYYSIIKPDHFIIPPNATSINKITNEIAIKKGKSIHSIIYKLKEIFDKYYITEIISHNLYFDLNILRSELYRYKYYYFLQTFNKSIHIYNDDNNDYSNYIHTKIKRTCTMIRSLDIMNVHKYPKLTDVYHFFYKIPIPNEYAHNAKYDTIFCYQIYLLL
jgi:DNA polymerase-3 subunit alpha